MRLLFASLSERDRRRSAAVEAAKLGPGGTTYLAHLFGCSERVPTARLVLKARKLIDQRPPSPPEGEETMME